MRTTRREFLGSAACAALGAGMMRPAMGETPSSAHPNVIVIYSDDQRFDTIAALGNAEIQTPNLDRLVGRGTAFTQATIMGGLQGAICVPSRAMLHTGRHLFHLEGTGNVIPPSMVTLPENLRAAGYRTCAIGKWHNDTASLNRGYSEGTRIFLGGMHDPWTAKLQEYDPTGNYPKDAAVDYSGRHATDIFGDAAVDFLARRHAAPFFLYLAFTAPHDPRHAPEEYRARYTPANITVPPNFMPRHPFDNGEMEIRDEKLAPWPRTPEMVQQHTADYYACITHLDAQVGRVLDTLDAQGLTESTYIVFAGDNGLAVGRHGLMGKQNLYEHSIRVPLIMAGPGVPKAEQRAMPCYVHQIFPTLCEALSLKAPDSVEARSFWPCLADSETRPYETTFHAYRDVQRAVRGAQYKLIQYNVNGAQRQQLFDVQNDPWELHDLSETHAAVRGDLENKLKAWQT